MVNDCEEKIKICLASDGVWVYDEPKLEGLMTKIVGVLLPLGIFFYIRMVRFRFRLMRDLKAIRAANDAMVARIGEMRPREAGGW